MLFKKSLAGAAMAAATVSAQRPEDVSICDYYTKALLKENSAENQYTVLNLVVNTAVIGNYTKPNVGIKVPGILAPGKYNGTDVNLLPYFNGELESSNRGGSKGVSVNFLDGGGAEPIMKNMPANDKKSEQYFLLTHLYEFFGALLGCSKYGSGAFPAYMAHASMYDVHKFMDLDAYEVGYFIQQVGLAAASFGVADEDVTAVGMALNDLFGHRCAPPTTAIKAQGPQLQSVCTADNCPLAKDAVCGKYDEAVEPKKHSMGGKNATMTGSSTATATTTPTGSVTAVPTAGAATVGLSVVAAAGAFAALLL